MKKHFHITLGGTYSVLADSSEEAIAKVESWFKDCNTHVFVEETDDNELCDYCDIDNWLKNKEVSNGN